jgi:hypothetical protein
LRLRARKKQQFLGLWLRARSRKRLNYLTGKKVSLPLLARLRRG